MNAMQKSDLILEVWERNKRTGISKKDVTIALNGAFEAIQDSLKAGRHVKIRGFGSFRRFKRSGGKYQNPKTLEPVMKPDHAAVRFKSSATLKRELNHNEQS